MGHRHARVLTSALRDAEPMFRVVGVVDRDVARAVEAARKWGVPALASEAEAIDSSDVVVIATPIATHADLATAVLEAGRDVFVEKPVCASVDEAHTVLAVAARERRRVFVGHSERFNPVVRALARLLRGDEVLAIELHRIGAGRQPGPDEPGVLVNLGVHDFDLAAYLSGAPIEVRDAVGRSVSDDAGAEDLAHVLLSSRGGSVGHVYVDRSTRARHRTVRVTTSRWVYDGDLLAPRLVRTPRDAANGRAPTEIPLPTDEPLAAQARALADAIAGGGSRELATGVDGARALAMAEEAGARIRARAATRTDAVRVARV